MLEREIPWDFYQALIVSNHKTTTSDAKACAISLVKLLVPCIVKSDYQYIISKDDIAFVMGEN